MSNLLRVGVTPKRLELTPGDSATVEVRIVNTSQVVARYLISVVGPAAAWSTVDPPQLEEGVMPDREATVTVTLAPPAQHPPPAGRTTVGIMVRATQADTDADASWVEELEVELAAVYQLTLTLKPQLRRASGPVTYDALVENQGNVSLHLRFRGEDQERAARFRFAPPELELPGNRSAAARVQVSAPQRWTGPDIPRVLTVHAEGAPDPPVVANATYVQRSRLSGGLLRGVGLFAVAALIAGSVLANALIRNGRGSESAANLASTSQPTSGGGQAPTSGGGQAPTTGGGEAPTSGGGQAPPSDSQGSSETTPTDSTEPQVTKVDVDFGAFPDGQPVDHDQVLTADAFAASKQIRLGAVPDNACPTPAAAVRSPTPDLPFAYLTSSDAADATTCNNLPVEISFAQPVRKVTLAFAAATSATYELKEFDAAGQPLDTVSRNATAGPQSVELSDDSANADIAKVTFGAVPDGTVTAITAIRQLHYER